MSFSVRPGHVFGRPFLVALKRLTVVGLKFLRVSTGIVMVLKFVPECCVQHFLIFVSPGAFPTFLYSCFWLI